MLKAAHRVPARRYQTARELAEDLQRYLNDEPIRPRPARALAKLPNSARRHSHGTGASAFALLLIAIGVAMATFWRGPAVDYVIPGENQAAPVVGTPETPLAAAPVDDMPAELRVRADKAVNELFDGIREFEADFHDKAAESLLKSVETYAGLNSAYPDVAELKHYAALAELFLGQTLWKLGRVDKGVVYLEHGLPACWISRVCQAT